MSIRTIAAASMLAAFAFAPALAQANSTQPSANQAVVVSTPHYDSNGNLTHVTFEYSLVCEPDFNCQV